MGTIRNGANGGFSGEAGSIIGSRWRDLNYSKGVPKVRSQFRALPDFLDISFYSFRLSPNPLTFISFESG